MIIVKSYDIKLAKIIISNSILVNFINAGKELNSNDTDRTYKEI